MLRIGRHSSRPSCQQSESSLTSPGPPSMGAWVSSGLGSTNENLPAFVVLVTAGQGDQPLYSRLWGNGFLDSRFQGVQFRSGKEPILYLNNPDGVSPDSRRAMLNTLNALKTWIAKKS